MSVMDIQWKTGKVNLALSLEKQSNKIELTAICSD